MHPLLLLLSTFLLLGLQTDVTHSTDAPAKAYVYQALIRYKGEFMCGGSIINRKAILTAASCVPYKDDPMAYTIIVGELDKARNEGIEQAFVPMHIFHKEEYVNASMPNDIAVILLSTSMNFNEFIRDVPLAEFDSTWYYGKDSTVTGWGGPSQNELDNNMLQFYKSTIAPNVYPQACPGVPGSNMDHTLMCVPSVACNKDQGGPLVALSDGKLIQVGIANNLQDCGAAAPGALFTRISPYTNWVDSIVRNVETGAGHAFQISSALIISAVLIILI